MGKYRVGGGDVEDSVRGVKKGGQRVLGARMAGRVRVR